VETQWDVDGGGWMAIGIGIGIEIGGLVGV